MPRYFKFEQHTRQLDRPTLYESREACYVARALSQRPGLETATLSDALLLSRRRASLLRIKLHHTREMKAQEKEEEYKHISELNLEQEFNLKLSLTKYT